MKRKQFLTINLIWTICWPVLQSTDIQLQIEKSEMSGPIEKIIDYGIGSNYDSGQVYCSKFLKIGKANLNDVSNRASNSGV